MSTQLWIAVSVCGGLVVAAPIGFACFALGVRTGRDKQWVDDYFEQVKRDKARRDPNGRFRKIEATANVPGGAR